MVKQVNLHQAPKNADSDEEFNITPGGTKTRKKKTAPGEDYD